MSNTRRALNAFTNAVRLTEESAALTQARQEYMANPEDEGLRNRFSQLSIPAGHPDLHKAAVNFQHALMATSKMGHVRGWQGAEDELEALQQAAQAHGIDPGLFVTPEGAGGSKREHVIHLTRLYGGKFLPGDGRSGMWEPMSHSFPDEQSAMGFANAMQQYYPETPVQPQPVPTQVEQPGPDGQPVPSQQMVFNVNHSHDDLGEPFPPGSQAFAAQAAAQRSAAAPHPHHVVVDGQGEHSVTLEPNPELQHQIVQTFVKGEPVMPAQPPQPEGEEGAPEEDPEMAEQPPEDPAQAQDPEMMDQPEEEEEEDPEEEQEMPVESLDQIDRLLRDFGVTSTKRQTPAYIGESDMSADIDKILNLYQNSTRRSPGLMMEAVPVDSNRGVTSRGNSQYDKYASPQTREKVLKSRLDEIEAFARSRSIPMSNVFAAAEASMRTGKVPDLGQYGLAGDDAVATKQFIISNVLNIQGLESAEYEGKSLAEAHGTHGRHPATAGTLGNPPMAKDVLSPGALRYMKKRAPSRRGRIAEEGGPYRTGGAPESATGSRQTAARGKMVCPQPGEYMKQPLLPKSVMASLTKELGNRVHGYPRHELLAIARERGLLGTEESVEESVIAEHDYRGIAKKHGGKYLGYVQPRQGLYEFPSEKAAQKFANGCASMSTATPTVRGKRVSIDEPMLGESGHLGYGGFAGPGGPDSPNLPPGPEKKPPTKEDKRAGKRKQEDRSLTDTILGIEDGDPRSESWPKMSDEMRKLLNLESMRSLAPKPGFSMPEEEVVQEATFGGTNVGGFIGGGMMGMSLHARKPSIPPYDASTDLEGSEEDKQRKLAALLKNLGLRGE